MSPLPIGRGTAPFLIPVQDGRDIDTRCSLQADANAGFETREVEVRVSPIDALDLSDIGVIKIDVEGHEFDVLNGARRTIIARKPIVIIECEERHNAGGVDRVKGFFADLGYDGFFLHRGRLRRAASSMSANCSLSRMPRPSVGRGRRIISTTSFSSIRRTIPVLIG
ncbi:MAG: FkbM family methyltransferase [Aliidongia sp.]